MTARHSLYKSKKRLEKASELQKLNSKLQRRINILIREKTNLLLALQKRKERARKDYEIISELREETAVQRASIDEMRKKLEGKTK